MNLFKYFLLVWVAITLTSAQSIPPVKAKALDNPEVILPRPDGQQITIFIVGFSRKSGELCEVWGRKIATSDRADARIAEASEFPL